MKAERYLLDYINEHKYSVQQIEKLVGINIEEIVENKKELNADQFMDLCMILGIDPDGIMKKIV